MINHSDQILLPLKPGRRLLFSNFVADAYPSAANRLEHAVFEACEPFVYLAGVADSGKTHLCAALLHAASDKTTACQYLSANQFEGFAEHDVAELLFQHYDSDILILEDIHVLAGNPVYEEALFSLFNHFRAQGKQLVFSSRYLPQDSKFSLPDLISRLLYGLIIPVCLLDEESKKKALVEFAAERGMKLTEELVSFIYTRSPRNMGALIDVLDKLDHASLIEKRGLTVPFVKKTLAW